MLLEFMCTHMPVYDTCNKECSVYDNEDTVVY